MTIMVLLCEMYCHVFAVLLWNKSLILVRPSSSTSTVSLIWLYLEFIPFDWGMRWLECYRGPGHQVQRGKYTWVDNGHMIWFELYSSFLHFWKNNGRIKPKEKSFFFLWETSWRDFDDGVNNTTEVTPLSTGSPGTSLRCIFGGVVSDWHSDRQVEKPIETLIGTK